MSIPSELDEFPPSPEVEREMALEQIRFFQSTNKDYRALVGLIHHHPSNERLTRLQEICRSVSNSSEPLIETDFFREVDPRLVRTSVDALINEIVHNRELASLLEGEGYDNDELDEEYGNRLVERVLANELEEDDDELVPIIIENPMGQLSTKALVSFMGGLHEYSVIDVFENLEDSEAVAIGLEKEVRRQERMRTVVIGLVAFAGALGGSLAGDRIKRNR
jgi:hypothetical protein